MGSRLISIGVVKFPDTPLALELTCCRIFWKQSSTGTLGILCILLRESRHTEWRCCLRAILAYWMMAVAEWWTITMAWLLCMKIRRNSMKHSDQYDSNANAKNTTQARSSVICWFHWVGLKPTYTCMKGYPSN